MVVLLLRKIIAHLLALILLILSVGVAAADNDTYVYSAKITNISAERVRLSFTGSGRNTPVSVNFKLGAVSVSSYYDSAKIYTQGKTAYMSVPDGEEFLLTCVLNTKTGEIGVFFNTEFCVCAQYNSLKNITPQPTWFLNSISSDSVNDESTVKIIESENFYLSEKPQSVSVESADTSQILLKADAPVFYDEILKIKVFDENNDAVKICDVIKNSNYVQLKFAKELNLNKKYTVSGEEICDIYGRSFSFSKDFTATSKGELSEGKSPVFSQEVRDILDFEAVKKWRTESDFLGDNPGMTQEDLSIKSIYEEQSFAATLSGEKKSNGNYSIKWDNHPYYPTLSAKMDADFAGANELKLWIYSEKATNEKIMLNLVCDNPKTLWKDGYFYPIIIDFTGEKEISIPLKDFFRFNEPMEISNVSQIYFSAKMFELTPNPETVIYIDNIRAVYNEEYPITPHTKIYKKDTDNHRGTVYDWSLLNHDFPEVQNSADINTEQNTVIKYKPYYKTERAIYGYFPKYAPAVPSFDKDGNAYFYKNGRILWLDDKGKWNVVDLEKEFLNHWGDRGYYFSIYDQMSGDETVIRFDDDGGVYVAMTVYSIPYLFYSPDSMESWKCYNISRSTGISTEIASSSYIRFERIEAHNQDASKNPPAFIYGNYLVIPQKDGEAGLSFKSVKYGEKMLGHNNHSGDGNSLITIGNNIYIVYAKYDENLSEEEKSALPDENSRANALSWVDDGVTFYSKDGTKAYIKRINRETLEMSEPVFAGYGGHTQDDHNWPNMTVDSAKRLHVFVNGHHDPIYYSYTLYGEDLTQWSEPILFSKSKDDSYASILTDKDDTIYVLTRDSGRGYHFDLSLYTKKKGETAFTHDYLVQRTFAYYKVWRNRMALDPVTNKIYVFYYSQSGAEELFKDNFDAFIYTWPDKERLFIQQKGVPAFGEEKRWYNTTIDDSGFEGVVLVSSDGAKTFNLAQTSDFKGKSKYFCEILGVSFEKTHAEVTIKSTKTADVNVFLGAYNDAGKLVSITKKEKGLTVGENNSVTFENISGAKNVKAFLWESDLKPLAEFKGNE